MRLLTLFLLLVSGCSCFCQDIRFSSDVKVVNLLATVRDSSGAIVRNLTRDDFRVEEDGRPQTIRYFSRESDLPLTIAILVDTSRSVHTVVEPERLAAERFFEQVLREDRDLAAVVHFDISVGVLQGLTSSRDKLAAALAGLRVQTRIATLLYDAIRQTSDQTMRNQSGRKAIVLLSDGQDNGSHTSLASAIEDAQRADTIIYSILFTPVPKRPGGGQRNPARARNAARGKSTMERLARETGGESFAVSADDPIDRIYARIEDDLRSQYSIGYTSDRSANDRKYRSLTVSTTRPGLIVRAREGYYPQ
jgi:VWFA-related protein